MTADLTRLKEDFDQHLGAHYESLLNPTLARTAFAAGQLLVEKWVERISSQSSKAEVVAPIQLMDILVGYQYLQKVCQNLAIRETYGRDLYLHYITQEITDVQDFLRLHLKIAPATAIEAVNSFILSEKASVSQPESPTRPIHDPLIQPYLQYRRFLEKAKEKDENPAGGVKGKRYEFIKSQSAGMELLEGFYETDSIRIDGQKPSLADLATMWQDLLGQSINNLYHKKRVILARKKDQTPYLSEMITAIKEKPEPAKKTSTGARKGST